MERWNARYWAVTCLNLQHDIASRFVGENTNKGGTYIKLIDGGK
jgi:hypothetical protein